MQGDIVLIKNSSGTVLARYIYDPWGNVEYKIPSTFSAAAKKSAEEIAEINPFRYRGYYYDTESNLYYLITRYYDPYDGVFISPDSFDYLDPNTIGGLNLYAYCKYNPVNYADPTGEIAITLLLIGFFVGAGIGFGGSVISQGISNGWDNINWLQAGFDGLIGGLTGLIGGTGIGVVGSVLTGGALGFLGSAGGDLIASGGDFSQINWGKAVVMGLVGIATGLIAGAGASNVKAMNSSINAGKSWGSKTFINFGVSIADKGASQLARQTAALYFSNAILGYQAQALVKVFGLMIGATVFNGLLNNFWR